MLPHPALQQVAHRPWPIPSRNWLLRQVWHDLLFLHWPVPAELLRKRIPSALSVDECDGSAWVAVTPFWMSDIGFRYWPGIPLASRFAELNVRTYVRLDDRPGVWFFSLDAASNLGVLGGRWLYGLPYHRAQMHHEAEGDAIRYRSTRGTEARFEARYGPTGPVTLSAPGSIEHWLTERYCLYAQAKGGPLYRAEIHHVPWPLQPASATIQRNEMLEAAQLDVGGLPALSHFSRRLEVIVWGREQVG